MLQALWSATTKRAGGWLIEIDIRKYFETIPHQRLHEVLRQRVVDGVLLRLIGKWLNAGVLEDGALSRSDAGTPQGGVISPLLANIFLHVVLDVWFEQEVKPRLSGEAQLFRYADDAVLVFANESDARKVFDVLPKRFEKYGLSLHPDKTRLVEFRRPDRRSDDDDPKGPATFDILGFTHYWGESRFGKWIVKRKTAKDRYRRALARIVAWCKQHRHEKVREQQQALAQKLKGHFAYFGITGNSVALRNFCNEVYRAWSKWLCRRSNRSRRVWWNLTLLKKRFPLPRARIVHSYLRSANP
jgi:group II intron reverse transcriptase/maturase